MPNNFSENPTCFEPDDSETAQAERSRQLTQLAKLWPEEFEDQSETGLLRLLAKLRKALREERRRGIAGHWTYSVTRHKALLDAYPCLGEMRLLDYKVRVVDSGAGTAASIRVNIESGDHKETWGTIGVSENIIAASWRALVDAVEYKLHKEEMPLGGN